jgi:hypothetical protein
MPQLLGGPRPGPEQKPNLDYTQDKRLAELSERTRLLEERLKQTRSRIQVVDETTISKIKDLKDSITSLSSELAAFRKDFEELKEIVRRMAKEFGSTAKVSDVKMLEKYISMLDVTRMVTRDEVIRIVKDELARKREKE